MDTGLQSICNEPNIELLSTRGWFRLIVHHVINYLLFLVSRIAAILSAFLLGYGARNQYLRFEYVLIIILVVQIIVYELVYRLSKNFSYQIFVVVLCFLIFLHGAGEKDWISINWVPR